MAGLDSNSAAPILKKYYLDPNNLLKPLYTDCPTLAMFKKRQVAGEESRYAVKYAESDTLNKSFNAGYEKAKNSNVQYVQFALDYDELFAHWNVEEKVRLRLKNSKGGYVKAITSESNSARDQVRRARYRQLFQNGWEVLGEIATGGISGNVITLKSASDIKNFEKGMKLQAVASLGSAARTGASPTMTVTDVDHSELKVTCSGGLITNLAVGDKLFRNGDYSTTAPFMIGMAGWIPDTTTFNAETSFLGVDRSVSRGMLAGTYLGTKQSTDSWETFLLTGTSKVARVDGVITKYVLSVDNFNDFVDELGSKVNYYRKPMEVIYGSNQNAKIGFDSMQIHGARGVVNVYPDFWCPDDKIFGFKEDSFEFLYLGDDRNPIVAPWDADGKPYLRVQGESQVAGSFKSYLAFMSPEPKNACMADVA